VNEDKATRYHRLKRRANLLSVAWSGTLLAALLWSGGHVAIRTACEAAAAGLSTYGTETLAAGFYASSLVLLNEAGALPLAAFGGLVLERRYGLSNEQVAGWLLDQAKAVLLTIAVGAIVAALVYWCIRRSPGAWWLPASAAFAALMVGLAHLAPIVLLPLFYDVKTLDRAPLRERLLALARRAGARALGVYEWGLSARTRKANAALTGIGSSKRILVSDTMLTSYSDEEIEVVLAHELAHLMHGDAWRALLLESAVAAAGFFAAAQVLAAAQVPLGLSGPHDLAGLPLIALVFGGVLLVTLPLTRAFSRASERRADRAALELTRNPAAFVSAIGRLAAQNLAEERPSRLVRCLLLSHPPTDERIAAARAFAAESGVQGTQAVYN
jgi:STE24 endopeptidase